MTHPCIDPSKRFATLLSEARAQFWGHGPQSQWDKDQTMCVSATNTGTHSHLVTHTLGESLPPTRSNTITHFSSESGNVGLWEETTLSLCVWAGVTFVLGVFPVENMLHFFMTITVDDGWLLGNRLIRINIDQHLDIVVINIQRSLVYTSGSQDPVLHWTLYK